MKMIPGTTNKGPKESRDKIFTKETSENTNPKKNELKIPEGAKDLTHTVRKIHNGFIKATSYKHPKSGDYIHAEVHYETDPFGEVGGIDSK